MRLAVLGNVLDDHVDIDVGLGQRPEDAGGDARPVGDAAQRDLRLVLGVGDTGDDLLFHDFILVANERSGRVEKIAHSRRVRVVEGGAHEGAHLVHHGKLDRAHLQHLGAERGHFQHFLEGDLRQPPRLRLDARVGRVDAVDIGIDVAAVGLDGGGDRHGAGVGAAAAERGDAVVGRDALEAGDDRHLALAEALDQERAVDLR